MVETVRNPPKAEVGLVLYPGCQAAMVHGMTDLLDIAGHFSAQRGGPTLRVSHWRPQDDGSWTRAFDTHPDLARKMAPAVLIVPGLIVGLVVSIFQAATQIQEQTLSFLPRFIVTLLTLIFTGNWLLSQITTLFSDLFQKIPGLIG